METPPLGSLEKAEKRLYSKEKQQGGGISRHLSEKDFMVKQDWGENQDMPTSNRKGKSFWHKFFTFSVVFFIFALSLSAFIFWRGSNIISSEKVDIIVNGPVGIAAGEELSFQVSILNRNNVDLEKSMLIVEYPGGTVNAENPEEDLPRIREEIGEISSGDKYQKVLKSILYGEENEKKTIKVIVEYRVEGSNAIFSKEKDYELVISSAPMSLLVAGPERSSAGAPVEITITAAANAEKPINNAAILVNYPFGFIFEEAEPKPTASNNYWSLGSLAGGDSEKIVIRGLLEGQNNEERVFRVEAGVGDRNKIVTQFTSFLHSVVIAKSALSLETSISGNNNRTIVAAPGENMRIDLRWQNNLQNQVGDATATSKISTSGFSVADLSASNGFYRTEDKTILWTKDRTKALALINPGERGILSYTFKIPSLSELASPRGIYENPNVTLSSSISGKDLASSGDSDSAKSLDERVIKISSPISISGRVIKKSDKDFTLVLTVKNPLNDLSGVKMTASLPTYVKWLNKYSSSEETISYNSFGGEIIWNLGKLPAGIGFSRQAREISIDLEIDTSLSGLSPNPSVINNIKISGDDDYTGTKVEFKIPSVNLNS